MNELTHDRCSELLGAYASEELAARDRELVDAHLAGCPACSSELAVLRALATTDLEPMTGPERERLTNAVRAAVLPPARPAWSERWGRRVAPALGAAALIAIAAFALVSLPGGGDEAADTAGGAADRSQAETVEDADTQMKAAPGEQPPAAQDATTESLEADMGTSDGGAGQGGGTLSTEASGSTMARPQVVTVVSEESFAVAGLNVGSLVPARSPKRTDGFRAVDPLADTAPNERVAGFIRTCAERAISSSLVPLVATSATYFPSDDLLLIGFVWVDDASGDLNFEIRGWRGGRCDRVTPIYQRGVVAQ